MERAGGREVLETENPSQWEGEWWWWARLGTNRRKRKTGDGGDGGDEAATGTVPIFASWFLLNAREKIGRAHV